MKKDKKFWGWILLIFAAIIVWHITSALIPSLSAGFNALTPFLLAFITAYLLRHPVLWTENLLRRTTKKPHRWQHTSATLFVLLVFLGLVALLIGLMIPNIIGNVADVIKHLPEYVQKGEGVVTSTVNNLSENLDKDMGDKIISMASSFGQQILEFIPAKASELVRGITGVISSVASFTLDFVLYTVASFILLHDFEKIKLAMKRCVRVFVTEPKKYAEACSFLHGCDVIVEKYIVVRLVTSLGIGIISYFGFLLFGIPYSLLLAIIIAVTNLIPYIGPFIGGAPVIVVALATGEISTVIEVCIFMLVIQQVEGNILTPWLTSDALEISPILVLIGIAVFGAMMGVAGMILGAPIVAIIAGLVSRAVEKAEKNEEIEEKNDEVK